MFRSRALAKLHSPENLDEPQKLIRRRSRGAIITVVSCAAVALAWSLLGTVPEEGRGQGILLTPGAVRPVQVPAAGQLVRWFVREGDTVEKGQVLGIVEQIQMEQQIDQEKDKQEELRERNRVIGDLRAAYSRSRRTSVVTQRETLAEQIEYLESYIRRMKQLTDETDRRNREALRQQKQNLEKSEKFAIEVEEALHKRLSSYERLHEEKLISRDQLRDVTRDHEDAKAKRDEIALRLQEMQLKEIQLRESYLNTKRVIATGEEQLTNLKLQQRDLDITIAQLNKADSEAKFRDEQQVSDVERTIERTEKNLSLNREIRTEYAGRVLELSAVEGQLMDQGERAALINARKPDDELIALAYFEPKHGKRLSPGTRVRVSPSTVDRNKHGGIIGEVLTISDYPVTLDSAATLVGNHKVAQRLTGGGFNIEVAVKLQQNPDNRSGYQWTSETGPDVELTAGTSADVWCTVEQRRPISYVAPKLKEWFGI